MKRAYITGRGLVTPLGIGQAANVEALRSGISGICAVPEFIEHNLESHVGGMVKVLPDASKYDRKQLRFCQPNALFALPVFAGSAACFIVRTFPCHQNRGCRKSPGCHSKHNNKSDRR